MVAISTLRTSMPFDFDHLISILILLVSIVLLLPRKLLLLYKSLVHCNNSLLLNGDSKSLMHCNNNSSGFSSLPEELLTDILLRLPAESLLRCKSVCKELHAIISTPSFINMHLNHQPDIARLVIYYCELTPRELIPFSTYSYFPDETTFRRHEVPDNLLFWGEITYFRGPCNGVFCIFIAENRFALWNPTTRKVRLIRCSPTHIFDEVGFGMDPLTGDFKIVLIHSRYSISPCFAVYTSRSDSWKYMEQESMCHPKALIHDMVSGGNAYYNGFYYWIKQFYSRKCTILAFDMHNEIFEEMSMPQIDSRRKALHLYNDSLALVSHDRHNEDIPFEMWVMEGKGRWKKSLSVLLPFNCHWSYGFWGVNRILMYMCLDGRKTLMVYDLDSNKIRKLKVENAHTFRYVLPILYKESLVSLIDKHGNKEYDIRSAEALEFMCYEGPKTKISCYNFREGPKD